MAKGTKKQTKQVLNEIKAQLIQQAERWGQKGYYTPVKLEEMELDQCRRIRGDLLGERANLEYELNHLESNKKESLIKLERLGVYLKRADRTIERHQKNIGKIINAVVGDREKTDKALKVLKQKRSLISIFLGSN